MLNIQSQDLNKFQLENEKSSRVIQDKAAREFFDAYNIPETATYMAVVTDFMEHVQSLHSARGFLAEFLALGDTFELLYNILAEVSGYKHVKLQQLIGACIRYIKLPVEQASLIIAEALVVLAKHNLVEWEKKGSSNSHFIVPVLVNPSLSTTPVMYPLPSVLENASYTQEVFKPRPESNKYEGVAKLMSSVAFVLNKDLAKLAPPEPKRLEDTWEVYVEQYEYAMRRMEGKRMYFGTFQDSRGRTYFRGYHINPQGRELQKVMLDRADGEFLTDSGVFWLKIAIANAFGLSGEIYAERIKWVNNQSDLMALVADAKEKFLFWKFANAYSKHLAGEKVHCPIPMDEVSSGTQYIALMLNCKTTMAATNLVLGDKVVDPRTLVFEQICKAAGVAPAEYGVTHKQLKDCVMQYAYSGIAAVKQTFSNPNEFFDAVRLILPALDTYVQITKPLNARIGLGMDIKLPNGWWEVPLTSAAQAEYDALPEGDPERDIIFNKIDNHDWVHQGFEYRYNAKKLPMAVGHQLSNGKTFTYQYSVRELGPHNLGLSAHIVHSVEAMTWQRAGYLLHKHTGQILTTVHDEGWTHPNATADLLKYLQQAKHELADSDVFAGILNQIKHPCLPYTFHGKRVPVEEINGIYACC